MSGAAAVFIPVRLSSTRLPYKAMREIKGKTCIEHLIDRVKRSRKIDLIVICTTTNKVDEKLVGIADSLQVESFRGSAVDILDRYGQAAKKFGVEKIINVDGDDIFCEPLFIDITSQTLSETMADCIVWNDVPLGSSPVGVRASALEKICSLKDVSNTETGWTRFFTETGLFNVLRLRPEDPELRDSTIRLTLDYEEDLRLFQEIYANLDEPFDLKDIVRLLRAKPELLRLNEKIKDIYARNFESKAVKVKLKNDTRKANKRE